LHIDEGGDMIPERIEREILIDAPQDVVWAIVTEPEHVGAWFSDAAEIDLRPGGEAILTWEKHGTARARVEKVEAPNVFAFRWARSLEGEPGEGNSTLVELVLSAEGDGTRLRVVESGFRDLDRPEDERATYAEENSRGWDHELGELVEYVAAQVAGPARR
jgi:uncharacterized protein YndB with AHSA1/START domain